MTKILPVRNVLACGLETTSSDLSKSPGVGRGSMNVFSLARVLDLANSYEVQVEASESSPKVVLFGTV